MQTPEEILRSDEDDVGEIHAQDQADELQAQEGQRRFPDVDRGDLRRRHALQVEKREAEGGRQEGQLHVHREEDAEPDRIKPQLADDGAKERDAEHDDPDPVDEAAQEDQDPHHDPDDRHRAQAGTQQQRADEGLTSNHDVQGDEDVRPEHGPHDHRGGLDRVFRRDDEAFETHAPFEDRDEKGPQTPHARRLGRRGDADDDRPQDQEDQEAGRYDRPQDLEEPDEILALRLGNGGPHLGFDRAADGDVGDVQTGQKEARQESPGVELPDRGVVHHAVDDQQDAGGNEDPQGAPGEDRPQGHQLVVLAVEHLGKRDEPHGHFRGPHDARHGRHHRAGGDGGRGDAALQPAEPMIDHVVDVLDDPAPLQDIRHEDEKRYRVEQIVGHQAEDPRRDDIDGRGPLEDGGEDDARHPAGKGYRQPHEEEKDHGAEDQYGQEFNAHANSLPVKAVYMSRMVQTTPWRSSRTPPKGIRNFTGKSGGAQSVKEFSPGISIPRKVLPALIICALQ